MSAHRTAARVSAVESIITPPADDIAPMRAAFMRMVSNQWDRYVPQALADCGEGLSANNSKKARFIGEMYARACYSMLLVSRKGPAPLRFLVHAPGWLHLARRLIIELGSVLIGGIPHLLPKAVHRQLLLTSALMGMLDVLLDDAACGGEKAALRVAALTAQICPENLSPAERMIVNLVREARQAETAWQTDYWVGVLQPAVRQYCEAEVLAVSGLPDSTGMGHRWAGIDAAIKGMWYAVGPRMGLQGNSATFAQDRWNREQQWMADTSLLMQMIDDWVDQDEDQSTRLTSVVAGDWNLDSAADLFDKTVRDLNRLLDAGGIQKPVLRSIFVDLYKDYLYTAMDAMRTGIAA